MNPISDATRKPFTKYEDQRLLALAHSGLPRLVIAHRLGRSFAEVRDRLNMIFLTRKARGMK